MSIDIYFFDVNRLYAVNMSY